LRFVVRDFHDGGADGDRNQNRIIYEQEIYIKNILNAFSSMSAQLQFALGGFMKKLAVVLALTFPLPPQTRLQSH
jgi:hypothetical protein